MKKFMEIGDYVIPRRKEMIPDDVGHIVGVVVELKGNLVNVLYMDKDALDVDDGIEHTYNNDQLVCVEDIVDEYYNRKSGNEEFAVGEQVYIIDDHIADYKDEINFSVYSLIGTVIDSYNGMVEVNFFNAYNMVYKTVRVAEEHLISMEMDYDFK